ncbi:MAG: hypothetical protein Q9M91_06025 [Candidatus Dojkabacteria bacterium]|nr:hypothetical protein [Candidatus Dojkabacteria bacterium]MDQ7021357.1 hypothetical protein [Candidatus Dojkabacteria bacterium]
MSANTQQELFNVDNHDNSRAYEINSIPYREEPLLIRANQYKDDAGFTVVQEDSRVVTVSL